MPLNARQRRALKHRVNLWAPAYAIDASTREQLGTTYSRVAANVPATLETQSSIDAPRGPFRLEVDDTFSRERWHFAIDVAIDSDWIIQNVTVDRFGANAPNHGRCWKVAGEPQIVVALGGRNANMKIVQAVQEPNPPPEITL